MFTEKPVYSAEIVRYALLLRYTSIQSYRMLLEHFPLPSLTLLHKISSGTIDAVQCAQTLRNEGKISSDVCLMFDEMYLQKCEEYFAGDLVGCNSEGELYKGLVCFMIAGLKNSIPYVIKPSPETKIKADWLKEELIYCLGTLPKPGFNVRAIASDNHPSHVSSFKNLLQHFNQDPDELFIWYELRKIYLFYDAVHLMKNIRNNLLNYKRFIFPSFKFDGFKDPINVSGGETKWKFFHDVAWQTERIPNCEKFTLTAQTSSALVRTLLCLASLIENLLGEGYDFVLTSRFQSDPLERRFGQYRQMSGGRFLVGLRGVTSSEKIITIKSLLKEDLDIDNVKVDSTNKDETTSRLLSQTSIEYCSPEHLCLSDDSKEVAVHIAGYIEKKLKND